MQEKGAEAPYTRDQSVIACEELDKYPFEQLKKLFHEVYESHGDGNNARRGDKTFNPLKAAAAKRKMELDSTTEVMVREIHRVVDNLWDEILALSNRPTVVNFGYAVNPKDIKVNNTGRLAATFLRSFFPKAKGKHN